VWAPGGLGAAGATWVGDQRQQRWGRDGRELSRARNLGCWFFFFMAAPSRACEQVKAGLRGVSWVRRGYGGMDGRILTHDCHWSAILSTARKNFLPGDQTAASGHVKTTGCRPRTRIGGSPRDRLPALRCVVIVPRRERA